ncbi:MAG: sugar phosphate isomerase/epimerase [Sphaerochaetaceae bacterium]|nr:sugar phosphate isomerase/epimerase [Sphaerochaetaceae bacterium]
MNNLRERITGIADEGARTIEDQLALHEQLGWESIELRSVDGMNVCEMPQKEFDLVAAAIEEREKPVISFGSSIANWARDVTGDFSLDTRDLRRSALRMHRLGTKYLRIMSYTRGDADEKTWKSEAIRRVKELTRMAHEDGIILLLENCDGWASITPDNFRIFLEEIDDPALQVVFDTGNPLAHGLPPQSVWDFYHTARKRIAHVHIKDCYRDGEGKIIHCYPAEGQCEVLPIVRDLETSGYTGMYSIEPHMSVQIHTGNAGNEKSMRETYLTYAQRATELLKRV